MNTNDSVKLAKKHRVRLTKNVGGKRVPKTPAELRANIAAKIGGANAKKIRISAKRTVSQRNNYVDENAMNNAFFNANNVPFDLRENTKNAINHQFKTALINDVKASPRLKRSAVALATRIKGFIVSGQFAKAVTTVASLFHVVSLYQNPRAADDLLNQFSKTPFVRAVARSDNGSRGAIFARFMSAFGASPTESQFIYESVLATIPSNAYGRSMAGIMLNYLAMVVLSLVSMLPWDGAPRSTSFRLLSFIFTIVEQLFPSVARLVFNVVVERKSKSQSRVKSLMGVVLPLIVKQSLG
ncbi:hypothetical protein DSLPV1_148 [Dishui lake phycodnavirus 1]|uniref:hypothetical protein n=1 Tax=Dishui lake phycodnavirus 1 TaxID=2079134 RepID=UPI000CD6A759|nr:hypothetical protein C5Y57_gp148 [Dishui lake phycodnavirus 1]AUT19119.1 hypothetical protein DSLPV1_148 [Dishui lake phycodnavirus 1]